VTVVSLIKEGCVMHRHNVLFNLKHELDESQQNEVIDRLRSLSSLPTVGEMIVERNILPAREGRAYYAWALLGTFDDHAAREAYEKDETHVDVVRNAFLPNVADFVAVDVDY
jgi:hypothetical protein